MKLKRAQVKSLLDVTFPDYTGRKISIVFQPCITFHDINWGGGTRNVYKIIRSDGRQADIPNSSYYNPIEGQTIPLPEDILVIEHSHFCGVDCGIRIHASPAHLPKWIEEPK